MIERDVVDVDTIDIFVPPIHSQFSSFVSTDPDGSVGGGEAITKSDGVRLTVGPEAVEFHAGRVFFAGIRDQEWIDTVFFSRIAQKPTAYGKAHQEQDPTRRSRIKAFAYWLILSPVSPYKK